MKNNRAATRTRRILRGAFVVWVLAVMNVSSLMVLGIFVALASGAEEVIISEPNPSILQAELLISAAVLLSGIWLMCREARRLAREEL